MRKLWIYNEIRKEVGALRGLIGKSGARPVRSRHCNEEWLQKARPLGYSSWEGLGERWCRARRTAYLTITDWPASDGKAIIREVYMHRLSLGCLFLGILYGALKIGFFCNQFFRQQARVDDKRNLFYVVKGGLWLRLPDWSGQLLWIFIMKYAKR